MKTCYGDVVKIVNALRDYAKLLETVCDEWDLGGFHRATYEYQAEKLRQIADKLQRLSLIHIFRPFYSATNELTIVVIART